MTIWHLFMHRIILILCAVFVSTSALAWTHGVGYIPATYYISPTGNDSNNGLTSGAPWLTPNHAVNCGDTIVQPAGTYSNANFGPGKWGAVSTCPSTAGIYFARLSCAGPYVSSCVINATNNDGMRIDKSNWAVVGAYVTTSGTGGCLTATPSGAANIHHIAFINVVANGCLNNGVNAYPSGGHGVDYFAVVGAIPYNSAQGSDNCYSGVSVYEPIKWDSNPGTHIFLAGIFSISNVDPNGCSSGANSDGEGVIFDDWALAQQSPHIAYTQQGVLEQSMVLGNGKAGVEVFSTSAAPIYVFGVTAYGDYTMTTGGGTYNGELLLSSVTSVGATITNSIFQANVATQNGNAVYAGYVGLSDSSNTVSGNYIYGVSGNNTGTNLSPSFSFGSNTNATPNFVGTTIPGAPTCATAATTTACMATTIATFTPQAVGAIGKGYLPPSSCMPDAYFSSWLAGVIPQGLITQPCGTN